MLCYVIVIVGVAIDIVGIVVCGIVVAVVVAAQTKFAIETLRLSHERSKLDSSII